MRRETSRPSLRLRQSKTCPECGSERLITDYETGERVCMDCGFVVAEKIAAREPEWRAFNKEQREKRRRVGMPSTFTIHDKGLSTTIDVRNRDAAGRKLSTKQRAQVYRMRKWQRRVRVSNSRERNLSMALASMSKLCANISVPQPILETASIIYIKALKKQLIRGRSVEGVAAASVYLACRKCGVMRTLDEVTDSAGLDRKKMGRCYRFIVKELREFIPVPPPSHYISRLSNHLGLAGNAEIIAQHILHAAKKMHLISGKTPMGLAAAAMYIASIIVSDRRTQREVAAEAGITEVTIRNRSKDILNSLDITVKL
jgi:transcription initiation factor TFIIB